MLGLDYPYICDFDADKVKAMIQYAKETYLTDVWYDGLDRMRKVIDKTLDETINNSYIEFLKRIYSQEQIRS